MPPLGQFSLIRVARLGRLGRSQLAAAGVTP
jgi:hypothetical protein